jgi:hypothetical protein
LSPYIVLSQPNNFDRVNDKARAKEKSLLCVSNTNKRKTKNKIKKKTQRFIISECKKEATKIKTKEDYF